MKDELCFLSASTAARMIAERTLSPVALMDAVLDRIDRVNGGLNAFITIDREAARAAAEQAEAQAHAGMPLGRLHGVPFTAKDLINSAGMKTTFGSKIMADNVPVVDAVSLARLRRAGAILIGKTTTPEFGHKPMTTAPLFGTTHNPWRLDRTPGGSSGGSAAAVAAGLAPLSIGTDGGGSTRIPAACCGVVGVKATLGRVPHDQTPDRFGNLAYLGPMTRTVADAALMLDIMAGADPADPHSLAKPPSLAVAAAAAGTNARFDSLRVAWRPRLGNRLVDTELLSIVESAVSVLADRGAAISEWPDDFENTEPHWLVLTYAGWAARFADDVASRGKDMDPTLVTSIERGLDYTARDMQAAINLRSRLYLTVNGWFDDADVIATPTLSRPPMAVDQDPFGQTIINGEAAGSLRSAWYPYTHPFNLTGHPAITIPAGFTADGLPVGLQLVAPYWQEERLFKAAAAIEADRPWAHRRPQL